MYVNGTSICTMLIINIIIIKIKKADIIAACNGEAFFHIEENKCFISNRNFILSFLTNQSQLTNILADCAETIKASIKSKQVGSPLKLSDELLKYQSHIFLIRLTYQIRIDLFVLFEFELWHLHVL